MLYIGTDSGVLSRAFDRSSNTLIAVEPCTLRCRFSDAADLLRPGTAVLCVTGFREGAKVKFHANGDAHIERLSVFFLKRETAIIQVGGCMRVSCEVGSSDPCAGASAPAKLIETMENIRRELVLRKVLSMSGAASFERGGASASDAAILGRCF